MQMEPSWPLVYLSLGCKLCDKLHEELDCGTQLDFCEWFLINDPCDLSLHFPRMILKQKESLQRKRMKIMQIRISFHSRGL